MKLTLERPAWSRDMKLLEFWTDSDDGRFNNKKFAEFWAFAAFTYVFIFKLPSDLMTALGYFGAVTTWTAVSYGQKRKADAVTQAQADEATAEAKLP